MKNFKTLLAFMLSLILSAAPAIAQDPEVANTLDALRRAPQIEQYKDEILAFIRTTQPLLINYSKQLQAIAEAIASSDHKLINLLSQKQELINTNTSKIINLFSDNKDIIKAVINYVGNEGFPVSLPPETRSVEKILNKAKQYVRANLNELDTGSDLLQEHKSEPVLTDQRIEKLSQAIAMIMENQAIREQAAKINNVAQSIIKELQQIDVNKIADGLNQLGALESEEFDVERLPKIIMALKHIKGFTVNMLLAMENGLAMVLALTVAGALPTDILINLAQMKSAILNVRANLEEAIIAFKAMLIDLTQENLVKINQLENQKEEDRIALERIEQATSGNLQQDQAASRWRRVSMLTNPEVRPIIR